MSQNIELSFSQMAGEFVRFVTFQGIQSRKLDSVKVGETGKFSFSFKTDHPAIAYLITALYSKWNSKGIEVVFISLDESAASFEEFVRSFPFISYCDYEKWNSAVVQDYYVFGTPTMFLLDQKREIILRPTSINQMDSWADWFLK